MEGRVLTITKSWAPRWLCIALVSLLGLATLTPITALADTDLTVGGTAVVANTNGAGAYLRSHPSYDAEVLLTAWEGASVSITGGPMSGGGSLWYAVTFSGEAGYLPAISLTNGDNPNPPVAEAEAEANQPVAEPASEPVFAAAVASSAVIAGTNGDGVRCRTEPSYASGVITVVPEGATIPLAGESTGEWQPTTCAGTFGYVHTDFVSYGGEAPVTSSAPQAAPSAPEATQAPSVAETSSVEAAAVSGYTTVVGTNGEGVRCRSAASYGASTITVLPEGTSVAMRGGVQGEWQPVLCAGMNGFAHASFLGSAGSTPQTPSAPVTTPAPTAAPPVMTPAAPTAPPAAPSGFTTGAHAKVNSSLNLRYQPHYNSGVAAVAEAGTVVLITGGVENGFYPVDWDGLYGYMHGDYLSATNAALSERGGSAAPEPAPVAPPASNPGSATGSAMASFALQYNGYPYVWATAGPSSFDCSGFTYWVTKNVAGIDIGRGLFTQVAAGTPVSRANLQPGDLVFFQNTYTWGLSHAGVYIGNGQMIHAENETTGVKISDINSDYYSSRWYGAVRLT